MRRREFLGALGGAMAGWPGAAGAQTGKLPTIGLLGASTPENWTHWTAAFVHRLGELGWVEGRTVKVEYRWARGDSERYGEIAAEFVRLNVDVIVTVGGAVPATSRATSTIPIVFAIGVDPVGSGLVKSLARPGGNVTGLSIQTADLAGKRIELLHEAFPNVSRFAIFGNVAYSGTLIEVREARAAARTLGLEADVVEVRRHEDIAAGFAAMNSAVRAIYTCPDPVMNAGHAQINSMALAAHLPTFHPFRDYLNAGGFMSYGANNTEWFRRAGDYVDRILRGTKAADLPVEQPTKFELIINLKTAKALGLAVSPSLLARADEVIE